MKALQFELKHDMNQEQKIIQQIQDINKKLLAKSYSTKNALSKVFPLKKSTEEQKYFSEQCDDLFADNNYPSKVNPQNPLDSSLFNSNNSLLLENQFEKEVKNFSLFSTSKCTTQNPALNIKYSNQILSNQTSKLGQNSKSNDSKKSSILVDKKSKIFPSVDSISKISTQKSQNTQNYAVSSMKNLKEKVNQVEKNIKNLIENKENIHAGSNVYKKQCFVKQIKNRIRFPTQPDECKFINQDSSLFDNTKELRIDKNFGYLMQDASKSKNKPSHNALECTFKPSILKKSNEIAQNLQPSFQRLTQDISISKSQSRIPYKAKEELTQKKYSIKRLQQLSQPRKPRQQSEREESNYDFRPTLSKKSLSQMANCTMDVASRNKLWLEQKQAKISKLKTEEEEKKLKKEMGPFVPKITPYKGENEVHLSRFTKEGISSYFERVSMAKHKNQTVEKKKTAVKEEKIEINPCIKKKTYDQAVKELHKRILTMKI